MSDLFDINMEEPSNRGTLFPHDASAVLMRGINNINISHLPAATVDNRLPEKKLGNSGWGPLFVPKPQVAAFAQKISHRVVCRGFESWNL
jgi:hypothetical protein